MTGLALVWAAVTIAFPPEGAKLPPISRCYVIGASDSADLPTGAWSKVVPVVPGTNVITVGDCRRSFFVEPPAPVTSHQSPATNHQPPATKHYAKLPYAGNVAKPHPCGKKPAEITIVLDPGHGGSDSGAVSPHGLPEKDANLRLAKAVRTELAKRGFRVVMTREDDSFPALYDRPKVGHREGADAFISIHHNAPGYEKDPAVTRYQAVYAWNPLGERLAQAIVRRMSAAVPTLESQGVLRANFAVTRNPEIPSCLIEADFVTSPDGESDIWDPARRERQAAAIAAGVVDWLNTSAGQEAP